MSIVEMRPRAGQAGGPKHRKTTSSDRAAWFVGLEGLALAVLVGMHGSAPWRSVRVLIVSAVTLLVLTTAKRAGVILLTFGTAGFIAGLGIGVRWLQKTGFTVMGVAGLLAIASSVVVLVMGASRMIRARKGWRRAWAIPIGLVLVVFVVYPVAFALVATNVPPTSLGSATPATRGVAYENVTFATSDGVSLSGWYIPSKNRGAIVLLHGSGSTRSGVLSHAIVLANHGYGVLLFDARGHGRSGGTGMDFGWYGNLDTAAAVSLVAQRPDVDPSKIAVVGMSMGGEEAIGAAAFDTRIRAVVGEGVEHRVYADDTEWLPHAADGWVTRGIERVLYGAMDLTTDASPPIGLRSALIAMSPRPALIIAAGTVENEKLAARAFSSGLPNVQTWTAAGAAHMGGLATRPEEWTSRVTSFLDTALGIG